MNTPEQIAEKMKEKFTKERMLVFFSVLLLGVLAHGYRLVNNIPNWDGLVNRYHDQNMIDLGRCFLGISCGISSYYELPFINGLLAVLYIAVTAVLVCEILEIKTVFGKVAAAGICVTFPVVTSTFCYMYTADGYFLGALCMSIAVWLLSRKKNGWIPATILICWGSGIYQAYLTFAISLILFKAIGDVLFREKKTEDVLVFLGKSLLAGGLGSGLYYLCLQLLMKLQHVELRDYQGISNVYSMRAVDLVDSVKNIAKQFFIFLVGNGEKWNLYVILNLTMLSGIIILTLVLFFRKKIYQSRKRLLLLVVLGIAVPVGTFAIFLIAPYVDYHMLMCYGMVGVYLYFVQLYEQKTGSGRWENIKKWGVLLLTSLMIFNFILIANISYHFLELGFDKSVAMVLRMSDRIGRYR